MATGTASASAQTSDRKTAPRHRFTVEKYHELIRMGAFGENDKIELINGELRDKMPIGQEHIATVRWLNRTLQRMLGDRAVIGVQDPVVLRESEPEPDVSVLRARADLYRSVKAGAADTLLIVEVADSSEDFDRDEKGPMYAEAGIPEYWLVCLSSRNVEVRRRPSSAGQWEEVRIIGRGESLAPTAFPDVVISVDELLPRP